MITEKEIIRRLRKILKSKDIQDRIAKASANSIDIGEIISRFESELMTYLPDQIRDDVSISTSKHKTSNGGYEVDVTFGNVWRPSLDPAEYPRGADNIVLLFNNGYSTHNGATVFGYWESIDDWIESRPSREALHFLQRFVGDFNSKYGREYNLNVTLSPKYE